MHKSNIDKFYERHAGYLDVIAGYLELPEMPFIMRACRLRPEVSTRGPLSTTPQLERWWIDECGNSLLLQGKRIKIKFNDLNVRRDKIQCTDLYANASLPDLGVISKLLFICSGMEEHTTKGAYVLSFLGRDNFLRTRIFLDGNWQNYSSLHLGIKQLKMISAHLDLKLFRELNKADFPMAPFGCNDQWISAWPPHANFKTLLAKQEPFLSNQLSL